MGKETAKKIPYADTKISSEQTKAEIERMLKQNNIKNMQWTSLEGDDTLKFMQEVEVKGVKRRLIFQVRPPKIFTKKRSYNIKAQRYEKITVPLEATAWRLVFWYLKNKLDAVKYGLSTLEQELMPQILTSLPDGSETTVGQIIEKAIAEDRLAKLPAPDETETPERKVVEVEYKEPQT